MTYDQIASDLAATFYAASLLPDPTLETEPRPKAHDAYEAKGNELAATLLTPQRRAVIRCSCGTRTAHPGQRSRAIAAVHDRNLLVVKGPRAPVYDGLRLSDHYLIDFTLARRDGDKSAAVWCYGCGALHELGFRWLQRAQLNAVSTPSEQYQIAEWGAPIAPAGYTPRHPNDVNNIAFAITTGPLDSPEVIVTLGWRYAYDYRDHFGFHPPHDQHLLQLVNYGDDRAQDPRTGPLPPQWWELQHDPELLAEERFELPPTAEEIAALAEYVRDLDASERQDALLTFEQLMGRPDFNRLTELLPEEAR